MKQPPGHQGTHADARRAVVALAAAVAFLAPAASAQEQAKVSDLASITHIHGLAVDRQDSAYLLIATHHGLYRAGPDGTAKRVSPVQDFMGFNPHPTDPAALFASGHPATGGNMGFIRSADGGKTWKLISPGANGPVDFHQMSVSPADPKVIYGAYAGDLQMSRDAGASWTIVGRAPDRLIDLAASGADTDTLYAATETGLLASADAGKTWKPLIDKAVVTMVETGPDRMLYAFVIGRGLVAAAEGSDQFTGLTTAFNSGYLLHLAIDPKDRQRMYAATGQSRIAASSDGGRNWVAFPGR